MLHNVKTRLREQKRTVKNEKIARIRTRSKEQKRCERAFPVRIFFFIWLGLKAPKTVYFFSAFFAAIMARIRSISLYTIMYPSSTPMPGLARICTGWVAIAQFTHT